MSRAIICHELRDRSVPFGNISRIKNAAEAREKDIAPPIKGQREHQVPLQQVGQISPDAARLRPTMLGANAGSAMTTPLLAIVRRPNWAGERTFTWRR